jgi:hypothetical protein
MTAPSRGLRHEDEHGSLDRVKDVSPVSRERQAVPSRRVRVIQRTLTTFPSSASKGHPLSPVRPPVEEETSTNVDGPTEIPVPAPPREGRRHPEDQVPSTVAATGGPEDRSSSLPAPASRSRRPHVFPRLGKGACRALQALTRDEPGGASRERGAFENHLEKPRLGLTTQARQSGPNRQRAGMRGWLPRSSSTGRSASTASTTESPRRDVPRTS